MHQICIAFDGAFERDYEIALALHSSGRRFTAKLHTQLLGAIPAPTVIAHYAALAPVFADLKITEAESIAVDRVRQLRDAGVSLITMSHTAGIRSVAACCELFAGDAGSHRTDILVVPLQTHITGTGSVDGFSSDPLYVLEDTLHMAYRAGASGIICPPQHLQFARARCKSLKCVVPGVRPHAADAHDHIAPCTPAEAVRRGADMIVIGRPITRASDPVAAYDAIAAAIADSHELGQSMSSLNGSP